MLESMTDKALTPAEEKLTMSCNDTDISHGKHLTVENNIEVFTGKKEKENFSDGMKMHNFTECCRMWMCSHCSKSFASSRALKIHEVKQHENATRHVLKCGTCHEEFEHANLLHIHMRVHHNVKVRCPRCKDIFEHPNNLKLHIKSHHSEPVCVACGLKFDHDKLLRLHMEHYHKVGDKGAKQGATKSGQQNGRKTKAVEDDKATGDAERGMKSVAKERENRGIENHEEMRQVKEDQVPKQANGSVFSEWEFGCRGGQHDDETTSHDSSDSKDEGSSDGEAGEEDPDEGSVSEPRETDNHITMEDQQCTLTLSPPQLNSEGESFLSKTKGENVEGAPKEMNSGLSPSAVECLNVPVQPRRSSVIVTTGKVSPPITHSNPRENLKRKADDSGEDRQELPKVSLIVNEMAADWETSPKRSPQSPAGSYARSPASTLSGDESGDSESANHKAHTPKRVTLRCNRCQEEFLSKMEYLHHLISHQNGDDNKMPNDLSPENQAIQKLKSTLRIKMKTERRDSFADEVNHGFDIHKSASPETSGVVSSDQTLYESNRTSPPAQKDGLSSSLTLPCTLCNKRFSDSRELKTHVESRHKKPQCTECGLQFDHKNLLKIHMNSYHSSLDVLQCYHCGKSFVNRTEFVSHVTSHETTVKTAKEARKGHSALRRLSSAPMAFESHSRIHSEIKRMFPDSVGDRNGKALGGKNETKKQGDEMLAVSGSDPLKSRFDDVRNYIERRFLSVGAFRHHKEETTVSSQKPEEWHNKERENFLIGPEARTRIFLPKQHEKIEHDHEQFGGHRPVPDEGKRLSPIRNDVNRDSAVAERFSGSDAVKRRFSAFTAYERTDRSNEVAQHMLLGRAKRDRDGVPLGRPPPLIPVVHPKLSHTLTRQPDSPLLRAHQPVTRTASANSALRYPRVLPYPALSPKWPPELNQAVPSSPVRDSPRDVPRDRQEFATRESINNITKEALLNSLSLRRRASAPELGARARPLSEPQRLAVPDSATIKNLLDDSPQRSEKRESPLAASPGRSRQLNEGYQPRRRHPRDFTCHHCGIYFGHKKLLKIHLDCYHGTSQELQCLRCEKNFSSRSEFLEHLMSHEGGDELLAFQRKRLRLDRRSSLPHEGETIIRRELNVNVANETAVTRKASLKGELELADIRGEFRHPLPEELKQQGEEKALEYPKPNNVELKHERRITGVKPSTEKDEGDDGANFCFVCGQSFSSGKRLEHHISSHAVVDKDGRYCCSLCPKTFDHHRKLEIHTRSHTGFKPHKCELCGRCFPYYSSYYYHKMTHTEDRPHKCGVCGKGFIQTRYLRSHMKTHPEQNGWASDEELNSESSPEQVKTSEDASTATKPSFSETDRKIKIEPVDEAAASVQRDLEEQDTARILCSFKQSSSVGLREQNSPCDTQAEVVTHGDVTSEETACTENSSRVDRTGEPSSPLEARESDEVEGNAHSIIVEGTVPNVQKETPQDQNVTNELLPKTKKKKYKCKHCEKNFSSYSSLHVHVRIHTGQRPYSCTHCFKKFTHSSGLKRHVRCHTGEKPYPCPACPSAFADRGALKSHIRTHTGERPFVCDLCNKTFTQPSSLRVHKKTVHAHEFFDEK